MKLKINNKYLSQEDVTVTNSVLSGSCSFVGLESSLDVISGVVLDGKVEVGKFTLTPGTLQTYPGNLTHFQVKLSG